MPLRDSHNNDPKGRGADRFKPAMPRIPGVGEPRPEPPQGAPRGRTNETPPADSGDSAVRSLSVRLLITIGLGACFACVLGWWTLHAKRAPAKPADYNAAVSVDQTPAVVDDPAAATSAADAAAGVTSVATLEELAKPWSAKKFTFVDPRTHEHVPAMIVRLPGAKAGNRESYWAFSLNAPYKTCQLDYLANPSEVASRYGYRASHPMVVAPCDATLYDPLRVGTTPEGAWVRGDIAQGPGIRPPISIEVRVQGGRIVADRIE